MIGLSCNRMAALFVNKDVTVNRVEKVLRRRKNPVRTGCLHPGCCGAFLREYSGNGFYTFS